jgi:hypothetical protein
VNPTIKTIEPGIQQPGGPVWRGVPTEDAAHESMMPPQRLVGRSLLR